MYLWVSGMFWTQDLQTLTVRLTLRVVDIAEQTGGPKTGDRDGTQS